MASTLPFGMKWTSWKKSFCMPAAPTCLNRNGACTAFHEFWFLTPLNA